MGASAVPQSTVASHPALQWVSTLTTPVLPFFSQAALISALPFSPIFEQISTSSSQISAARR